MNLVEQGLKALGQQAKPDIDMKIFQARYDATLITLYAKDIADAMKVLEETDEGIEKFRKDGKLWVKWDESYSEPIHIEEVKMKRGIIAYESH